MGALHYGVIGKRLHSTALSEDLFCRFEEQLQFSMSAVSGDVQTYSTSHEWNTC